MSEKPEIINEVKLSFKESIKMLLWSINFVFKKQKFRVILDVIIKAYLNVQFILYSFIVSLIIDSIIDVINNHGSMTSVYLNLGYLFLGYLLDLITTSIELNNDRTLYYKTDYYTDLEFTNKVKSFDIEILENSEHSNTIERAKNAISKMYDISNIVNVFIAGIIGFLISAYLVYLVIPLLLPLIVIFAFLQNKVFINLQQKIEDWRISNTEKSRISKSSKSNIQSPNNLIELKISNATDYLQKGVYDFQKHFDDKHLSLSAKRTNIINTFRIFNISSIFMAINIIVNNAINGLITIGEISYQLGLIRNFSANTNTLLGSYRRIFEIILRIRDLYQMFNIQNKKNNEIIDLIKLDQGPDINIKNLDFKYPDSEKYVLNSININIKSGEKVALVGHNGAGKTTLIKLISKIYNNYDGEILINNIDLKKVTKDSYYKNLGVLFQEFNTYPQLSVEENIVIGDTNKKHHERSIKNAAEKADATSFINDYEKKFQQLLMPNIKNGIRPSWGQWQKIAIARFFYRDAPLVIFDEPTAAIDAVSEYKIFNRIYKFFKGKTVILISHRFSTVRNADKIIVLDKGRIAEVGNHDELIKNNGVYAHSFNLQAEGYK